ncbi:hypothetical protein ACFYXS_15600 [Streptomyces sp. NPDC002574]|uniref:hypothetical protein n=1 Tax=Streptomyces sp. NPDC002574 TaxID=3364652 RepID=UPI00369AB7F3
MLRIEDGRTGGTVELEPGRRAPLRVVACLPPRGGPQAARVIVTADVLARTVEFTGGQVLLAVVEPTHAPHAAGVSRALGAAPPAILAASVAEAQEGLAGRIAVRVVAAGDTVDPGDEGEGVRMDVGPVTGEPSPGLDLRLALLGRGRREPLELAPPTLDAAAARLTRWRQAVALWAEEPSKPMCAPHVERVRTALSSDLDTRAVLDVLDVVAGQAELPPGSRFETFAHVDRVLGLELTREVGGVRP